MRCERLGEWARARTATDYALFFVLNFIGGDGGTMLDSSVALVAGAGSIAAAVGCCGWSGRIGGSEQGRNLLRRLPTSNEQRSSFLWLRSQFHTRIL
jgi:hypothetical protein